MHANNSYLCLNELEDTFFVSQVALKIDTVIF